MMCTELMHRGYVYGDDAKGNDVHGNYTREDYLQRNNYIVLYIQGVMCWGRLYTRE